jgi:hypothetical protein
VWNNQHPLGKVAILHLFKPQTSISPQSLLPEQEPQAHSHQTTLTVSQTLYFSIFHLSGSRFLILLDFLYDSSDLGDFNSFWSHFQWFA